MNEKRINLFIYIIYVVYDWTFFIFKRHLVRMGTIMFWKNYLIFHCFNHKTNIFKAFLLNSCPRINYHLFFPKALSARCSPSVFLLWSWKSKVLLSAKKWHFWNYSLTLKVFHKKWVTLNWCKIKGKRNDIRQ